MTDEADEFIRAVMADMLDTQQSLPPDRAGDAAPGPRASVSCWPSTLVPGAPRWAGVTGGRVAWQDHIPVETRWLDAAGRSRTPRSGGRSSSTPPAGPWPSGVVEPEQVVAVSVTGQWASTVPVDAAGHPVADCVMWMDTRGGAPRPGGRRRPGGRLLAAGGRHLDPPRPGAPPSTAGDDPLGHMLHLERDQPEVARAARWYLEPVDYLSMRFTGVAARIAGIDDAPRGSPTPAAPTSGTTTRSWCAGRGSTRPSCHRCARPARSSARVRADVAAELGISAAGPGGDGNPRPALGRGRGGGGDPTTSRTW